MSGNTELAKQNKKKNERKVSNSSSVESNGLVRSGRSERDNRENWSGTTTLGKGGTAHDAHQLLESVLPPKCLWQRETSAPPNTMQSVKMRPGARVKLTAIWGQIPFAASLNFFAIPVKLPQDVAALLTLAWLLGQREVAVAAAVKN